MGICFVSSPLPYDLGQLVFRTEQPPPDGSSVLLRPFGSGCNFLYCSEKLLQFLKATNIRLQFYNHTLVQNEKHRYFGLRRIHVTGRLVAASFANPILLHYLCAIKCLITFFFINTKSINIGFIYLYAPSKTHYIH